MWLSGLSKLGIETAWISRVGILGYFVRNQIRSEGLTAGGNIRPGAPDWTDAEGNRSIGNKGVLLPGKQRGLHLSPKDLKEEMLQQAELLYLTGITPVLSESCERTVREAIRLEKNTVADKL